MQTKLMQICGSSCYKESKGFRFQKNKNVRFISGNFSRHMQIFVKTIRYGLPILINQQAPPVSVFRIYHIKTHETNI